MCRSKMKSILVAAMLNMLMFSAILANNADDNDTPITYFPDLAMQFYNGERIVSEKCLNQSRLLFRDLQNLTFWASEMWDASAKQPSGFLYGSTHQLGNFDECIYPTWGSKFRPYNVTTQYCLADIYIRVRPNRTVSRFNPKYDPYGSVLDKVWYTDDKSRGRRDLLYWALCVPGSCSYRDVEALLNGYLNFTNSMSVTSTSSGLPTLAYEASLDSKSCQTQKVDIEYRTDTLAFFWFISILIFVSVVSTSVHYFLRLRHKRNNTDDPDESVPPAIMVFSLIRQFSKLSYSRDDEIKVLNGIKFISICLVIMDHRFGTTLSGPMTDRQTIERSYNSFEAVFLVHGDLLVDTFFVISGLVFCLNILKFHQQKKSMNIPLAIAGRYLRLVPVYAFCMMLMASIVEFTGNGPQWKRVIGFEAENCRSTWWIGLLMLGNYINFKETCMVHTWYIPCDFHFFLLSMLCFMVFKNRKVSGLTALAAALVVSILIPAAITFYYRLPALLHFYNDFLVSPRTHEVMNTIYVKSHTRAGTYIVGIITGCIIFYYQKRGNEKKLSTSMSILGTVVGMVIMFAAVSSSAIFYDSERSYNAAEAAMYAALIRPIWALGLCLLILCCIFGDVPIVNRFLTWSPFSSLSKLVYGMYMVHMIFQLREVGLVRQPLLFDVPSIMLKSCGDMVFSSLAATFTYVLIESPVRDLFKFTMNGCRAKRHVKTVDSMITSASKMDSKAISINLNAVRNNFGINNVNINRETFQQKL